MERLIGLALGYVCGLLQTGYLYGRMNGIDIRDYGSGNAGTTNALRVLGKKAGLIVFLGDFLKAAIPCIVARYLFRDRPDIQYLMILYTGFGVVLGHNYPFYLKFRGGKGIAATGGLLFSTDWRITLACLAVFVLIVAATRYVSLGSLVMVTVYFAGVCYLGASGVFGLPDARKPELYLLAFAIMALAYWKHRANIVRLAQGKENKLGAKKAEGLHTK